MQQNVSTNYDAIRYSFVIKYTVELLIVYIFLLAFNSMDFGF